MERVWDWVGTRSWDSIWDLSSPIVDCGFSILSLSSPSLLRIRSIIFAVANFFSPARKVVFNLGNIYRYTHELVVGSGTGSRAENTLLYNDDMMNRVPQVDYHL